MSHEDEEVDVGGFIREDIDQRTAVGRELAEKLRAKEVGNGHRSTADPGGLGSTTNGSSQPIQTTTLNSTRTPVLERSLSTLQEETRTLSTANGAAQSSSPAHNPFIPFGQAQIVNATASSSMKSGDEDQGDGKEQSASARHQQILSAAQRKQNIACDGCRGRKVKCVRQPGIEKCDHCRTKNTDCTSHYVTSLSTSRRKVPLNPTSNGLSSDEGGADGNKSSRHKNGVDGPDKGKPSKRRRTSQHEGLDPGTNRGQDAPQAALMAALLAYLFSAHPVVGLTGKWRDPTRSEMAEGMPYAPTFWGQPSSAHLKLNSDEGRRDLASDLIETYFQIVHIRTPLLDPGLFRRRFHDPDGPDGPPMWPILACVLAWGAKFSEHSVIIKDREECSLMLPGERRRSRLIQMVAVRAQQVAEICKVYRVPSLENVQACLMLNTLEGGNIHVPNDFVGMFGKVACTHMVNLRYHKRAVLQAMEGKRRASAAFAFWMTCWVDGYYSAFYGYKPQLLEGDWDVEPEQAWSAASESSLNPMSRLEDFLLWSDSITGLCKVSRSMATYLWQPRNETHGIPMAKLKQTVSLLATWRDEYLTRVGVPTVWPETWDFIAAVTACTEDADYHIHWAYLSTAIKKWGIQELKRSGEMPNIKQEAETLRDRIHQEAMHGALRISALAGVLTQNSYLRLDPNVLFASLYRSGLYLAEAGRMECATCVAGLRQYGLCFEEAFDRADEVEAAFQKTSAQPIQSNSTIEAPLNPHSSMSVVPQRSISSTQNATYPFPPNLGHMPIQPSTNNDFTYGVSQDLNSSGVSQEFYGLPDQHGISHIFYDER